MYHTAYKVTTSRNAYGDYTATGETAITCHFRTINEQVTGSGNETVQSDAMIWTEPDSGLVRGDIIKFEGEHYRVERITKARRLRNPTVLFLKIELLKYGTIS